MPQLSRRTFLRATSATALGSLMLGMGACSTGDRETLSNNEDAPLSIGYVPIACASPLLIAEAAGVFERHGLNVALKKYAGWSDLWSAYSTGELNIAHMLSPMPVAIDSGVTNGKRPTELSFTQNTNGQAITLAAEHHPRVQSAADMTGMVLGIPFEYSVHALLLRDYLVAGGVDPVADVELRLLRPADMVAQLEVGGIDGFIGPEPFNQRALQSGSGRIFLPTRQLWDKHPCCAVAMAKDWRSGHPDTADQLLRALHEAAGIVNDPARREDSAQLLSQEKYLNQPVGLLSPALAGHYRNWEDEEVTDPEMMSFGDPTDPTAIIWMAAQIARWDLSSGTSLPLDDAAIIAAAASVLPAGSPVTGRPVQINGQVFDPTHPTRNYSL
ncbi:ABC transporter substrate-binding protein [Corynebacterium sp. A21]|uniref:ABC transporter substrate-binding protein n=1 Tax=Corynebacterium sp. A21 TaxID=3457318 RepID=UPI003FD6B145